MRMFGAGIFLGIGVIVSLFFLSQWQGWGIPRAFLFSPIVLAGEDDEDEDEENEEDDDTGNSATSPGVKRSSSATTIMQTVTKQVTVYETRLMNDPEFLVDTDGDLLVDAIDPEPNFDQREYFTDTDGDGVPNAFDKHHDEDDFAYHDDDDADKNGILDSYE